MSKHKVYGATFPRALYLCFLFSTKYKVPSNINYKLTKNEKTTTLNEHFASRSNFSDKSTDFC
ncbi:MAG: hypothetical protein K8S16_09540, partial [Bacteroidales bacterium]|nr:hypothetical protein [Bacteroidales bacterium]